MANLDLETLNYIHDVLLEEFEKQHLEAEKIRGKIKFSLSSSGELCGKDYEKLQYTYGLIKGLKTAMEWCEL